MNASLSTLQRTINTEFPAMSAVDKGKLLAKVIIDIDAAMAKPVVKAKPVRKSADRNSMPTLKGDHAFIRLVACELAIMDAYGDDSPVEGYSTLDLVPTIADVNAAYSALRPYAVAVDGLQFGRNSALYAEAVSLIG